MRARVKPSKASSVMGIIGGILVLIILFVIFIPNFASSGFPGGALFPVIMAILVVISIFYYIANISNPKGISVEDIDIDKSLEMESNDNDFDKKLRKLEGLKKDNLITEEEYKKKRAEMMKHSW